MANTEVPLTLVSSPSTNFPTLVVIGKTRYGPPSLQTNSYWFSVYDRNSLQQVYSVVQTANADTVPPDLSGKYNTPQYFLAVTTVSLLTAFVPAGPLFSFLVDNGASVALKRLTQFFDQVGCGNIGSVAYAMAGLLGPGPSGDQSVEGSMIGTSGGALFLTATLVGVPVPPGILYTPVPLTQPKP